MIGIFGRHGSGLRLITEEEESVRREEEARLEKDLEEAKRQTEELRKVLSEKEHLLSQLEKAQAAKKSSIYAVSQSDKDELELLGKQIQECMKSDKQKAAELAKVFGPKLERFLEKRGYSGLEGSVCSLWKQMQEDMDPSVQQEVSNPSEIFWPQWASLLQQTFAASPTGSAPAAIGFPDQSQGNEAALSEPLAARSTSPLKDRNNDALLKSALKLLFKTLGETDVNKTHGAAMTSADQDYSNLLPKALAQSLERWAEKSVGSSEVPATAAFTNALKELFDTAIEELELRQRQDTSYPQDPVGATETSDNNELQ